MDPSVALAFSLFENRGVYALLLGSGLSRAAQIPTGWDITLDLIRRVAELEGVTGEADWAAWHRHKSGKDPNYSEVLDGLTTLPDERRSILHTYIAPTPDDVRDGRKVPTRAHHAIARLVRDGFIRVIITTNFDRLLETALRESGVEPTVIRSDDDLRGAVPLIHNQCFVLKLHGDYLDTRIRNTDEELAAYSPVMNTLLDRILDDHGLVVCGWSGDWDHALRAAIARAPNRRFPTFWAARGPVSTMAGDLIQQRAAKVIPISDADGFFTELQQRIAAQAQAQQPNPRSTELLVATAKRYIGHTELRIQLNDFLAEETRQLAAKLGSADFPRQGQVTPEEYQRRVARYEAITEPLARIFGIIGRWGDVTAAGLARDILGNFTNMDIEGGTNCWLDLRFYPAVLLFYAYGLGVLKAGHYGMLFRWLTQPARWDQTKSLPFVERFGDWESTTHERWKMLAGLKEKKTPRSDHLHAVAAAWTRDYILSDQDHTSLFETFEVLSALAFLTVTETKETLQANVATDSYHWAPVGRAAWDRSRREAILQSLEQQETRQLLLQGGFSGGDEEHLTLALRSARRLMGRIESMF